MVLRFWCNEFDYNKQQICIRSGGLISYQSGPPGPPSVPAIHIIDPFIRSKVSNYRSTQTPLLTTLHILSGHQNVTKNVLSIGLTRFKEECELALRVLNGGQDLSVLIQKQSEGQKLQDGWIKTRKA